MNRALNDTPPWNDTYRKIWSQFHPHEMLMRDRKRNLAYQQAISRIVKKDDVVIDLGCGTGLFSCFAARAGAKKVYALDYTDMISHTKEFIRQNGYDQQVECVKKDIYKCRLPQKADVLIHFYLSSFIFGDGHTPLVNYARQHLLKPNARIIPNRTELYLVPVDFKNAHERAISFWSGRHYGLNFKAFAGAYVSARGASMQSPQAVSLKNKDRFLCDEKMVHAVDYRHDKLSDNQTIDVQFKIMRAGQFTGCVGYCRGFLDENTVITSAPKTGINSLGQFFLPSFQPQQVKRGSTISLRFTSDDHFLKWRYDFEINP